MNPPKLIISISFDFVYNCRCHACTESSILFDFHLDFYPEVYDTAATMLGLPDSSKLSLFAGPELINRHADLSQAPIADGVAWIHKGMQVLVVFCFVLCFLFYSMYVYIFICI